MGLLSSERLSCVSVKLLLTGGETSHKGDVSRMLVCLLYSVIVVRS